MSKRLSMIALLGTVTLAAGCGSSHDATGTGGTGGSGGAPGTGGSGGSGGVAGTGGAYGRCRRRQTGTHPPPPPCVSGGNTACLPSGFPFVQSAFADSKACNGICPAASPTGPSTILFSQPKAGTLCLSGTNLDSAGTELELVFTQLAELSPGHLNGREEVQRGLAGHIG